ncbi:hypothetical protein M413DRAFT_123427 [Hebeloma cylindrosporum]|uniref:Uncharacterized protein n=1 Tax=Hebeloma cylindrosporum TaxID=76867 RepID=A0A0C2XYS4_HEBCY|nr:hypothetical protein M413DRAFT_123427 [Hebeloma cylindrosporum h7]
MGPARAGLARPFDLVCYLILFRSCNFLSPHYNCNYNYKISRPSHFNEPTRPSHLHFNSQKESSLPTYLDPISPKRLANSVQPRSFSCIVLLYGINNPI